MSSFLPHFPDADPLKIACLLRFSLVFSAPAAWPPKPSGKQTKTPFSPRLEASGHAPLSLAASPQALTRDVSSLLSSLPLQIIPLLDSFRT